MLLYDKVIHLVPEYPPVVGGVSDFSATIKKAMEQWNVSQEVVVAGIKPYPAVQDTEITSVEKNKLLNVLVEKAGKRTLLVFHYVCYGYSLKGVPFFMPGVIRNIKKSGNFTVLTYFHELYATDSSPFKSAFWLGSLQKKLAQKLAALSDYRITTSMSYKTELDQWCQETKSLNICMPVFSNIPESSDPIGWNKKKQLVIFGSRGARNKVYRERTVVEDILKKTSDYKWIDIGAEVKCDEVIERKGLLSAQEVAAVLKESELGLINYEDMPIEKSGVFAAYAANGVVPVVMSCNKGESTYKPGVHYIEYNKDLDLENIPVNQIRLNLYSYYMEAASVSSHIKIIRELLTN